MPADITILEWSLRLVVAAVLSGLIGFEREARHKAAGLRTHMLVGLGAALFTLVGAEGFEGNDPARVAAQIVTGVGFLGAGAIFRRGATVSGLTTAAGLWAVAAIGMTAGAGLEEGAIAATVIAVVILYGLGLVETKLAERRAPTSMHTIAVTMSNLRELSEIVMLVSALDDKGKLVGVGRPASDEIVTTFDVHTTKLALVTAGVRVFDTVLEVGEMGFD